MTPIEPIRITLRLPRDVAQDVIVRHALRAREWRQLPFDPLQPPIEVESLVSQLETSEVTARMLPWLLDSILRMVGDAGWSVRYDRETAVSVAGAVRAFAFESGFHIPAAPAGRSPRILVPMPRLPMWLN